MLPPRRAAPPPAPVPVADTAAARDLRALMEQATDLVYVKDAASRFVRANAATARFFGLADPAELIGKTDFDLFPEALARRFYADEQQVVATGRPIANRLEPQSEDEAAGTWFLTSTAPITDAAGRVVGLVGIARDVTERHRTEAALRESEERLAATWAALADAVALSDAAGIVLAANPAYARLYGFPLEDVIGQSFAIIFPEARRAWAIAQYRATFTGPPDVGPFTSVVRRVDGSDRVVESRVGFVSRGDERTAMVSIIRDVTERTEMEEELRESEERFRRAFDDAAIGMALVAPDGRFLRANRALCELVGYPEAELLAKTFADLTHPDDLAADLAHARLLLAGTIRTYQTEKRYLHHDGHVVWVQLSVSLARDAAGRPLYFVSQLQDVTARKALEARLRHQATHDPLTGLPNRALFVERLTAAPRPAVVFLDLDGFKVVNDSLGHDAGDRLLVAVGQRLAAALRAGDLLARFGGDEFAVLPTPPTGPAEARRVATRLLAALAAPFPLEGQEVAVGASAGVAVGGPDLADPGDLLRAADVALYRAKAAAPDRVAVFDAARDARALDRLARETELRRGLERGEFRVAYQPVVALATGALVGVEALVRRAHPARGLLAPDAFIPLAEETGLILPLGRWVRAEACRQVAAWQARAPRDPPLRLSANLSPREFRQPALVADLARTLEASGLAPQDLTLEVTETAAIADPAAAVAAAHALAALGVRLAVDDFGTGYASLSALKRFPVAELKVDRSFVAGLGRQPEDEAIVRAAIGVARALGLGVTAEGIETAEQARRLRELGCELGQGYHFGAPLAAEELDAALFGRTGGLNAAAAG